MWHSPRRTSLSSNRKWMQPTASAAEQTRQSELTCKDLNARPASGPGYSKWRGALLQRERQVEIVGVAAWWTRSPGQRGGRASRDNGRLSGRDASFARPFGSIAVESAATRSAPSDVSGRAGAAIDRHTRSIDKRR